MSKLFLMYDFLKKQNPNTIFLFKSGIFYLAIDQDAMYLSELLNLKLTPLNKDVVKCGLPSNSLEKYLKIFKAINLNVKIINPEKNISYSPKEYEQDKSVKKILNDIQNININELSVSEAYQMLETLKQQVAQITNS